MELKDIKQAVQEEVQPLTTKLEAQKTAAEAEIKKLTDNIKLIEEKLGKNGADEVISKQLTEATASLKAIADWKVTKDEADKKNQELLDKIQLDRQRQPLPPHAIKSYAAEVEEALDKSKDLLAKKNKFELKLERKTVGDLGSGNLTGSYFITPDVKPGVIIRPYEDVHLRNLLPVGSTTSTVIRYVRDNGGEGGPGMVAQAATKPQMDRDLSIEDANVRKIACYIRIPEEMIEDIAYITGFITNIGTLETLKLEDTQIIYGDGTGQNLSGLFTNATAFAPGAGAVIDSPNRFDVIRAARMQMRKAFRRPSFALLSPTDYYVMTSAKDSTGNYILMGGGNGLLPNLDGVTLVESTSLTDGDFLVGDRNAAEIDFRSNLSIRFFEQDQDNAIKNMVTIVIEERLALPIYYTNGFVKGTFDAAVTALTAGS
jgi:HK97 family phage major capsid protein